MNGVDLAVILLVAGSGMIGLARGVVREALSLLAWVGAGATAYWFFPQAQEAARRVIGNPDLADPVAFGGVFLAVLIAISVVARLLGGAVRNSPLGGLDRVLGLGYGLMRGAAVIVVAYVAAGAVQPMDHWPEPVLEARTLPSIYLGAVWAAEHIPDGYRPALTVPPAHATATDTYEQPVGRSPVGPLRRL